MSNERDINKVWMIYKDEGDFPEVEHPNQTDAEIEMGRLSRKEPDENFYLLEIVKSTFKIVGIRMGGKELSVGPESRPEPKQEAIEVGDTVTGNEFCRREKCKVIAVTAVASNPHSNWCAVQNIKVPQCVCNSHGPEGGLLYEDMLILVEKGPKVHEFKGVVVVKGRDGSVGPVFFPSQSVDLEDRLLKSFHQDGNLYTLKMIEEVND